MRALAVRIGNFFFHYRDRVFPIFVIALFALAAPPTEIFGSGTLENVKDLLAFAIAILGLAVRAAVIGFAYIKRGGRLKRVYAADLVTEGMFGVCRNPLYLGNLLICLAIFLMHGDVLIFALGTGIYILIYQCIVLAEEAYLTDKFGEAYRRYCAEVPRWLPRLSHFRHATEGMTFKARRVIDKDYATIALSLTVLAATEAYEVLAAPAPLAHPNTLVFLTAAMVACGIWTALIKLRKRRAAYARTERVS